MVIFSGARQDGRPARFITIWSKSKGVGHLFLNLNYQTYTRDGELECTKPLKSRLPNAAPIKKRRYFSRNRNFSREIGTLNGI